jgi:hypothetical protein
MAFFSSQSQSQYDSPTAFSAVSNRLESPSAERKKDSIWTVLSTKVISNLLSDEPWTILETAAGAGVHTEYFSSKLLLERNKNGDSQSQSLSQPPAFVWHATDPTEEALQSIVARVQEHKDISDVVAAPKRLTLDDSGICQSESGSAPEYPLDLVLSINMIHIAPWEATLGLMKVAGEGLREPSGESDGGYLYCYGPYRQEGIIVPSNENFDMSLKSRNPSWGVRNLADVVKAAESEGLELVEKVEMPANNTSLIFRRIRKPKT